MSSTTERPRASVLKRSSVSDQDPPPIEQRGCDRDALPLAAGEAAAALAECGLATSPGQRTGKLPPGRARLPLPPRLVPRLAHRRQQVLGDAARAEQDFGARLHAGGERELLAVEALTEQLKEPSTDDLRAVRYFSERVGANPGGFRKASVEYYARARASTSDEKISMSTPLMLFSENQSQARVSVGSNPSFTSLRL